MEPQGFPSGKITLTIEFETDGCINITAKDLDNACTYAFRKEPNLHTHNKIMEVLREVGVSLVKVP